MSTSPTGYAPLDVSGTAGIPFWRLVWVELRKSVDTLAGRWLVAAVGAVASLIETLLLIVVIVQDGESSPEGYTFFAAYGLSVALPILAIMLVTGEWTQRTAMLTFSLEPRRALVLAAKYVAGIVLTLTAVVVAVVVGLACTLVSEIANPASTTWELGGRFLGGFVVTQVLAMSLGFALACLLLNTPAAIVLYFVYRILPIAVFGTVAGLVEGFGDVVPWISFEYAQGPLYDLSLDTGEEWAHLLVSGALWLGLPLGLGIWRILRAEVK